jgi:hypothetical protein
VADDYFGRDELLDAEPPATVVSGEAPKRKARRERMARREMEKQEAQDDVAPLPSLLPPTARKKGRGPRTSGSSSQDEASEDDSEYESPEKSPAMPVGAAGVVAAAAAETPPAPTSSSTSATGLLFSLFRPKSSSTPEPGVAAQISPPQSPQKAAAAETTPARPRSGSSKDAAVVPVEPGAAATTRGRSDSLEPKKSQRQSSVTRLNLNDGGGEEEGQSGRGRSDSLDAPTATARSRTSSFNTGTGTRSRSGSLRHTEIGSASNSRGMSCPNCGRNFADAIMVELHLRTCAAGGVNG